jgi:hypothetical protein
MPGGGGLNGAVVQPANKFMNRAARTSLATALLDRVVI